MKHLLDIDDLGVKELERILELGLEPNLTQTLKGRGVACIFEKPSTRTRNSTEMAVKQLGGHPIYITGDEIGIDVRESASDIARTLACYHEVICARVYSHEVLQRLAEPNVVPIVNLLSDRAHPLQAIADAMTICDELGTVSGKVVTYVGDTNNVAVSLAFAVGLLGGEVRFASPHGYGLGEQDRARLSEAGVSPTECESVDDAVAGADVIYTDTWISMGQESEQAQRLADFAGYTVDEQMMIKTDGAIFMHCLPAHRGQEVSAAVIDGEQSRVWRQAAMRQNAARAVLSLLTEVGG